MSASLVGSEMCIRDSNTQEEGAKGDVLLEEAVVQEEEDVLLRRPGGGMTCLLYTSDAADDM
eukprot:8287729-Alexandrium_andersonii.AAC.1